jgi:hypothetical protein
MRYYPHFILPMRRSRGFASTAANCVALFRLAFASATPHNGLTSLTTVSRSYLGVNPFHEVRPLRRKENSSQELSGS